MCVYKQYELDVQTSDTQMSISSELESEWENIRLPGIEPGLQALSNCSFSYGEQFWEARVLPLDHSRVHVIY